MVRATDCHRTSRKFSADTGLGAQLERDDIFHRRNSSALQQLASAFDRPFHEGQSTVQKTMPTEADLHPRVDVGNVFLCNVDSVAQVIHHPVLNLQLLLDVLRHLPESVDVLLDNGQVLVFHLSLAVTDLLGQHKSQPITGHGHGTRRTHAHMHASCITRTNERKIKLNERGGAVHKHRATETCHQPS